MEVIYIYRIWLKKKEEWTQLRYDEKHGFKISNRYLISTHGRVYIKDRKIYSKLNLSDDGYECVRLSEFSLDIPKCDYRIHRLVALAFIPNPNNLPIINHLTGKKNSNYFENLEWSTNLNNTMHAIKHGLIKSQLTYEQVEVACQMMSKPGWTYASIMANVGKVEKTKHSKLYSVLRDIRLKCKYKSISKKYNILSPNDEKLKYSNKLVHNICKLLADKHSVKSISEKLKCDITFVQNIYYKKIRTTISDLYFKKEDIYKRIY